MNIHWCIVRKGIITSHYKWDPKAHTWKERKERKRRGWEEGGREGEERKRRKSQKKACKLRSVYTSVQCSRSVVSDSLRPHKLQPGMLQLPEFTQTRVHWVSDAIQLSQPLSSPSPPALNLSQHQGLFKWVRSSHQSIGGQSIEVSASTSVLPMNIQDWFPLGWTGWISLQSKGLSRVFSITTVQKHQFFGTQLSL